MTTAVYSSSSKVSVRSTLSRQGIKNISAEKRKDLIRIKGGELVPPEVLSSWQRFLNRNCDFFSISMDVQTLVFKDRVQINGLDVDYKLVMRACIDSRGVENFVHSFYRDSGTTFVTTGLLVKAFSRTVQEEVTRNLQFVDVRRVSGSVRNATRHSNLAAALAKKGIRCLSDDLTIESVSYTYRRK